MDCRDALSALLITRGREDIHNKNLDDGRLTLEELRKDLSEYTLRKLIIKVQQKIDDLAPNIQLTKGWDAKKELKKQEDVISEVGYILGLTEDRVNGAKNRIGSDPISQAVFKKLSEVRKLITQRMRLVMIQIISRRVLLLTPIINSTVKRKICLI